MTNLDGRMIKHLVRQFVAMLINSTSTIEKQIFDAEKLDAIEG